MKVHVGAFKLHIRLVAEVGRFGVFFSWLPRIRQVEEQNAGQTIGRVLFGLGPSFYQEDIQQARPVYSTRSF